MGTRCRLAHSIPLLLLLLPLASRPVRPEGAGVGAPESAEPQTLRVPELRRGAQPPDGAAKPAPADPRGLGIETVCELTPELREVSGHLLFEYRVDNAGRVHDVKQLYASVDPHDRQSAFSAALAECVRRWAVPPGPSVAGAGAVTHLIPFHYFRPAPAGGGRSRLPDGRAVPDAWFHEMDREKLRFAEALLGEGRSVAAGGTPFIETGGTGWTLRTDVTEEEAGSVRDAIEYAVRAFNAAFPGAPPVPADAPLSIVLFRDEREYDQFVAFDNFVQLPARVAGLYSGRDRMIYGAVADRPIPVISGVMVHEATHHLVTQRLYGGNREPPLWVNEGIAVYIECLKRGSAGVVHLAALDHGMHVAARKMWPRPADEYLSELTRAVEQERLPGLEDLVTGRLDGRFLSEEQKILYGTSWLLVHYLVNADGGRYRNGFQSWLLDGDAPPGAGAFAAAVGGEVARMQTGLRLYLEQLGDAPGVRRGPDGFAQPPAAPDGPR